MFRRHQAWSRPWITLAQRLHRLQQCLPHHPGAGSRTYPGGRHQRRCPVRLLRQMRRLRHHARPSPPQSVPWQSVHTVKRACRPTRQARTAPPRAPPRCQPVLRRLPPPRRRTRAPRTRPVPCAPAPRAPILTSHLTCTASPVFLFHPPHVHSVPLRLSFMCMPTHYPSSKPTRLRQPPRALPASSAPADISTNMRPATSARNDAALSPGPSNVGTTELESMSLASNAGGQGKWILDSAAVASPKRARATVADHAPLLQQVTLSSNAARQAPRAACTRGDFQFSPEPSTSVRCYPYTPTHRARPHFPHVLRAELPCVSNRSRSPSHITLCATAFILIAFAPSSAAHYTSTAHVFPTSYTPHHSRRVPTVRASHLHRFRHAPPGPYRSPPHPPRRGRANPRRRCIMWQREGAASAGAPRFYHRDHPNSQRHDRGYWPWGRWQYAGQDNAPQRHWGQEDCSPSITTATSSTPLPAPPP